MYIFYLILPIFWHTNRLATQANNSHSLTKWPNFILFLPLSLSILMTFRRIQIKRKTLGPWEKWMISEKSEWVDINSARFNTSRPGRNIGRSQSIRWIFKIQLDEKLQLMFWYDLDRMDVSSFSYLYIPSSTILEFP